MTELMRMCAVLFLAAILVGGFFSAVAEPPSSPAISFASLR